MQRTIYPVGSSQVGQTMKRPTFKCISCNEDHPIPDCVSPGCRNFAAGWLAYQVEVLRPGEESVIVTVLPDIVACESCCTKERMADIRPGILEMFDAETLAAIPGASEVGAIRAVILEFGSKLEQEAIKQKLDRQLRALLSGSDVLAQELQVTQASADDLKALRPTLH